MVALKNLLLLVSTVTAAAISKRDIGIFFNDLDTINTNSLAIIPLANSWTGDLPGAVKILASHLQLLPPPFHPSLVPSLVSTPSNSPKTAQSAINAAVLQANTDTVGIFKPLTDDQTKTLFGKVDTITANLGTLSNAFKAKKPVFDKAGFTPVVVSQITTVSTSFHFLAVDATELVGTGYQATAAAKANAVDAVLKDLLFFFGGVIV